LPVVVRKLWVAPLPSMFARPIVLPVVLVQKIDVLVTATLSAT